MSNPNTSNEKIPLSIPLLSMPCGSDGRDGLLLFNCLGFRLECRLDLERQNHTIPREMSLHMYKSVNGGIAHQTSRSDPLSQTTYTYPTGRFYDLLSMKT